MTAGRSLSQAEINSSAAGVVASLFAALDNVTKMKTVLDGYSSTDLVNQFGFTQADADVLKSAFGDMANLAAVWQGQAPSGTMPRDHRVFCKRLLGTGLY